MPIKRKVDPRVGKNRSQLSNAVKLGKPDVEIARLRHELAEAKVIAAVRKVAAEIPSLSSESRAEVLDLLTEAAA